MSRDAKNPHRTPSTESVGAFITAIAVACFVVAGCRPSASEQEVTAPQQAPADDVRDPATGEVNDDRVTQPRPTSNTQRPGRSVRNADVRPADTTKPSEADPTRESVTKLKRIAVALFSYHGEHEQFPPPVLLDPDGQTPHSWRVALLPHLGEEELYDQYDLTQPWDSEENLKVLEQMPDVFRHPMDVEDSTHASYFGLVGEDTAFGAGPAGHSMREFSDGTSATLLVVEAKREIPWTKPKDIPYSPEKPIPGLGGWIEGGFGVAMADGSARFISNDLDEEMLRRLITRNDGKPVTFE